MNFGASNNPAAKYDKDAMMSDVNPEKLEESSIQNMILRQTSYSINWIEQRGNPGDNVNKETIEQFHTAVLNKEAEKAAEIGHTILETQMHPTAEDICKSPIKQFCYNVLGKRAYNYKIEE